MADDIRIRFRVDGAEEATNDVREFDGELDRLGGTASTAGSGLDGLTTKMAVAAAGAVALGAAVGAWANRVERTVGVMRRLRGSVDQAQDAIGGMVSRLDLAIARNGLLQAGLEVNDEQFASTAVVAQEYAAAIGIDTTDAIERLGEALIGVSAEELERFGIRIDTSKTRSEQFADALRQLTDRAHDLEGGADTAAGGLQRFKVALDDAATSAAEMSDVALGNLIDAITGVRTETDSAADQMERLSQTQRNVEDFFDSMIAGFGAMAEEVAEFAREFRSLESLLTPGTQESEALTLGERIDRNLRQREAARRGGPTRAIPASERFAGVGPNALGGSLFSDLSPEEAEALSALPGGGGGGGGGRTRGRSRGASDAAAEQRAMFDNLIDGLTRFSDAELEESMIRRGIAKDEARERQRLEDEKLEAVKTMEENATAKARAEAEQRSEEAQRRLAEQEEAAEREFEKIKTDADSVLQPAISGITSALSEVIAGSKSADEAFAGMLSSFLGMIAQRAALEAASEYAAAIASFATYQYDAGALHLAAGAAWTGVAVAAGAGAIATAPSDAAPASPEAGGGGRGRDGGNTIVYNVSGPVISAGTRARAGREVGNLVDEGDRRFGRTG